MIAGICLRDLPGEPTTTAGLAAAVLAAGATVVHVPSPDWFTDDAAALRDVGITLAVGLGQIASGGDDVARRLDAARGLGATSVHLSVATVEHRASAEWPTVLADAVELLTTLVGQGVEVVLKTHEDMSTQECLEVVAAVPGLKIGFSPVNVLVRMEDPLLAAQRVAAHVHTVFLDDATLGWVPGGLHRWMRPVGSGSVPWSEILALLAPEGSGVPVVLDLHRAEFDVPFLEAGFAAREPHLTVGDVLGVLHGVHDPGFASTGMEERRAAGWDALQTRL